MIAHAYVNRKILTNEDCLSAYVNEGYVTRGADWYELTGGMQDYGYLNYGTIEVTMEISCCKYPASNSLENYWNYNRDAMIEYLYQAQRGLIFLNKKKFLKVLFF
jgi:carboxypeptidase D